MNGLQVSGKVIVLPEPLIKTIVDRIDKGFTGKITIDFRDGEILSFEETIKTRIDREAHVSRENPRRVNSHGQQLQNK